MRTVHRQDPRAHPAPRSLHALRPVLLRQARPHDRRPSEGRARCGEPAAPARAARLLRRPPGRRAQALGKWYWCFTEDQAWEWLCAQPVGHRDLYEYVKPGAVIYAHFDYEHEEPPPAGGATDAWVADRRRQFASRLSAGARRRRQRAVWNPARGIAHVHLTCGSHFQAITCEMAQPHLSHARPGAHRRVLDGYWAGDAAQVRTTRG